MRRDKGALWALGAAGALAALSVGSRRGGPNTERGGRGGGRFISVSLTDLSHYDTVGDMLDDDAIVVSYVAEYAEGHTVEVPVRLSEISEWAERACERLEIEDDDPGGVQILLDELGHHIDAFESWLLGLRFPLRVYRGVALGERGELDLSATVNPHWTTEFGVAWAFASGSHDYGDGRKIGAIIETTIPEPPGTAEVAAMLDMFMRYTAGDGYPPGDELTVRGQWEILHSGGAPIRLNSWIDERGEIVWQGNAHGTVKR